MQEYQSIDLGQSLQLLSNIEELPIGCKFSLYDLGVTGRNPLIS